MNGSHGVILSPGYPEKLEHTSTVVEWRIQVLSWQWIKLDILEFDVNCMDKKAKKNYIEFPVQGTTMAYCGDITQRKFTLMKNELSIHLVLASKKAPIGNGFLIEYIGKYRP